MKKAALALAAIMLVSALLLSSAEPVEMANANPTMYAIVRYSGYTEVDPIPVTTLPSVTICSPKSNADYSSNNIPVNYVAENAVLDGWQSHVISIYYSVDGNPGPIIPYIADFNPPPVLEGTFNLSKLPLGRHELTVTAYVDVIRDKPEQVFFLDCSSTAFFSVGSTDYSPAPNPTPTPAPTPTPEPSAFPRIMLNLEFFPTTLVIACVSVVAVITGIGLLGHFRKHKGAKNP